MIVIRRCSARNRRSELVRMMALAERGGAGARRTPRSRRGRHCTTGGSARSYAWTKSSRSRKQVRQSIRLWMAVEMWTTCSFTTAEQEREIGMAVLRTRVVQVGRPFAKTRGGRPKGVPIRPPRKLRSLPRESSAPHHGWQGAAYGGAPPPKRVRRAEVRGRAVQRMSKIRRRESLWTSSGRECTHGCRPPERFISVRPPTPPGRRPPSSPAG